jgi:hypothetical protein
LLQDREQVAKYTTENADQPARIRRMIRNLLGRNENLNWEKQFDKICKKASAGIGAIKRAKPYVDINTLQTIYKALVQPYFNYCCETH